MDIIEEKVDKFFEMLENEGISVDASIDGNLIELYLDSGIVLAIRIPEEGNALAYGAGGEFDLSSDEIEELMEILDVLYDFNIYYEFGESEQESINEEND